jgi:hypothetical protein
MWVTISTSKRLKNLKIKTFADFKKDMLKFFSFCAIMIRKRLLRKCLLRKCYNDKI